ncbi:hypothetical protein RCXUPER_7 [Rhodobacter phage RcXuper]|nr:hypothetical protein RCXUPER_7 [Rhodobacter phage RcXuper]
MTMQADTLRLFGAFFVDAEMIPGGEQSATVVDLMLLANDYNYVLSPEFLAATEALTAPQKATVFKALGATLQEVVGDTIGTSPMYRDFPRNRHIDADVRFVLWIARWMGYPVCFEAELYGADPVTGQQNPLNGFDPAKDDAFTIPKIEGFGNSRRTLRVIRPADRAFIEGKVMAMMSNLTPFSDVERRFIRGMIGPDGVPAEKLTQVRFREKLVELFDLIPDEDYAKAMNSVTDVLRLAVKLSGTQVRMVKGRYGITSKVTIEPDLSLKAKPRFNLKTAQTKRVLALLEAILSRGTTDFETDLLRHEEAWKRFAEHVRMNQYEKRFPLAHEALQDLRNGLLLSWESKYANGTVFSRIAMARKRPGTFVRRMAAIWREVNALPRAPLGLGEYDKAVSVFMEAAAEAMPQVDVMKLLQLYVYATRTSHVRKRFHMLPNGKMLTSERTPESMATIAHLVGRHLRERLGGTLEWNAALTTAVEGIFIPAGNRSASEADQRTARGDRVSLAFEETDTIRLFLHWKHYSDVDLSAVFFDADLTNKGECSYFSLHNGAFFNHSGDIRNGSTGAAEYVDIHVGEARKRGIRYILMAANVYSGTPFDQFPCYVGAMIRDGKTGKHFDPATVEAKLALTSATTTNAPVLFDLETGEMVYVDMPGDWRYATNVRTNAGSLQETLEFFTNYGAYRPSFADVIQLAGTEGGPVATADAVRSKVDEVLAALAAA